MNDLMVKFMSRTDSESWDINVYHITSAPNSLIATGSLNLCTNMAHITILPAHEEAFEDMEFDIVKAIEERDIYQNRIIVN